MLKHDEIIKLIGRFIESFLPNTFCLVRWPYSYV